VPPGSRRAHAAKLRGLSAEPTVVQLKAALVAVFLRGQGVALRSVGVAGVACAGIGAWLGQRLGGSHATAGLGAAIGVVAGLFAPSASSWVRARAAAHARAAGATKLWYDVSRPSRLLDPARGVVEFTGRAGEIVRLIAWCEDDSANPMRLITGPGGVGKTRLALRLSELMQELGWRCIRVGWARGRRHCRRARSLVRTSAAGDGQEPDDREPDRVADCPRQDGAVRGRETRRDRCRDQAPGVAGSGGAGARLA
jgi:hypothetical protein